MDNWGIFVGAAGVALFTLWLTLLSTRKQSPAAPTRCRRRNPLKFYWQVLNYADPELTALIWALGSTLWGAFVATPFGMTTAFPYSFPDNAVGLIVGVVGALMFVAMGFDLHRTYSFATLGLGVAWGFVGWSAWATSSGHSSAWIVYVGAALVTALIWARLHWDDTKLAGLASEP